MINLRLGKEEFDCLTLDATYDCGCGPGGAVGVTAQNEIDAKAAEITGMDESDLRGFGSVGKGDGKTHGGSGGGGDDWIGESDEELVRGSSGMGGTGHDAAMGDIKEESVGDYDG
jgi:hypothetical protein